MTRRIFEKSLCAAVAALAPVLLTTTPLAATPTLFNLTNVGPTGANLAGVYTSPYTATIGSTANVPAICDDFSDESYVPETWWTYVTPGSTISSLTPGSGGDNLFWLNASSGPGSTVIAPNGITLDQADAYAVAAVLAVEITQASGTVQEDLSYSLWGLFDPSGAFGQLAAPIYASDLNNATTYLDNAVSEVFNHSDAAQVQADLDSITVYSYDSSMGVPTGSCGGPCTQPQEFIVVNMAEPPSPALLGVDLLGLAGLILIARRQGWLAR